MSDIEQRGVYMDIVCPHLCGSRAHDVIEDIIETQISYNLDSHLWAGRPLSCIVMSLCCMMVESACTSLVVLLNLSFRLEFV